MAEDNLTTDGEGFVAVPGFPDYQATTAGRIFCLRTQEFVSYFKHKAGYRLCQLRASIGTWILSSVHKIIALTFHGPVPDGLEVNHKNDDKADNRPSNLEYMTHAENVRLRKITVKDCTGQCPDCGDTFSFKWRTGSKPVRCPECRKARTRKKATAANKAWIAAHPKEHKAMMKRRSAKVRATSAGRKKQNHYSANWRERQPAGWRKKYGRSNLTDEQREAKRKYDRERMRRLAKEQRG